MLRIIDKQTNLFMRDDFEFNPETEIGMDVEPAQGFYLPKWDGETWEEGATQEYIDSMKAQVEPQEPTVEDMAIALMQTQEKLEDAQIALDFLLMGGI